MTPSSLHRDQISGVAIDLGGTKIAVARFIKGEIVDQHVETTDGDASVVDLIQQIASLTSRVDLNADDRVGVAVTGRVDEHGNWYAVNTRTLSAVNNIPLQQLLSKQFNRPCRVLNDAVAGAIAEYHLGAGMNCQRMMYLTVSTGVGAGFILDGNAVVSSRGLAGHVGFASSRYANQICGSGRYATIESVASGNAIAAAAERAGHVGLSAKQVFEHHHAEQQWATDILKTSARAIAEHCSDMVAILDIEQVVLGGSIGQLDWYRNQIEADISLQPALFRVPVATAALGQSSVLLGALIPSR